MLVLTGLTHVGLLIMALATCVVLAGIVRSPLHHGQMPEGYERVCITWGGVILLFGYFLVILSLSAIRVLEWLL